MIDFCQSRDEAIKGVERSLTKFRQTHEVNIRQGRGPGHILFDRVLEHIAEAEQQLSLIQSISPEEWAQRQQEALANKQLYLAHMRGNITALWESDPPPAKEEIVAKILE